MKPPLRAHVWFEGAPVEAALATHVGERFVDRVAFGDAYRGRSPSQASYTALTTADRLSTRRMRATAFPRPLARRTSTGRRGSPSEPGRRRRAYMAAALMTDQIDSTHSAVMKIRETIPSCVPMCVLTR